MAVKGNSAIIEISKIHPELAALLQRDSDLSEEAARVFAEKKGIPIDDAINRRGDWSSIIELARYISDYTALDGFKRLPKDVNYERVDADGIPAEWIINPNVSEEEVIFYLFGGGYLMGTLETRRRIPLLLGRATKMRCFQPQYRLAPEHPFPAAIEDSIKAYKWLLSTGIKPNKVIIGGDSAGGGLSVSTLLKIKELKLPMPAGAVLLSPWVDLTCKGKSLKENAKYEPELATTLRAMASIYLVGPKNKKNPLASPILADLSGLPPLLIQAGGIEVLLDDSITLAERAKAAGVDVVIEVWDGMTHVFQSFGYDLEDSKRAIEKIKEFIYKIFQK